VTGEEVDARIDLHRLTASLIQSNLLAPEVGSRLILNDLIGSLGQPITLTEGKQQLLIIAGVNLVFERADTAQIDEIINAAASSSWLEQWCKDAIVLYGRSVERGRGADVAEPIATDQLPPLLQQGEVTSASLASWLSFFRPSPEAVSEVFGSFSHQHELPQSLQDTIRSLTRERAEDDRRRFFGEVATGYISEKVGLSLVAASGFESIDPIFIASELSRLFDDANNNSERERVMQLWRLIGPTADGARRTLVDRVYIPLLRQGKGAAKIALDYFDLVRTVPSKASRDRIRTAIKDEVKGDNSLKRRANSLLRDAGWVRRSIFR
jgi:hypothetical protein